MTSYRQVGATADNGIYLDATLQITATPLSPALTIRDAPSLGSVRGPIVLAGATVTTGGVLGSTGGIIVAPPITILEPILLNPPPFWVAVNGTAQEGQTLTATSSSDIASTQWQELIGGSWVNLQGATASTYTIQPEDVGRQIRIEITFTDSLTVTSGATNAVLDAAGNQYVYETANATTIESGLFQYVHGTALATTIDAGGEQNVYADGFAAATVLNVGGVQIAWGYAEATSISGGTQIVWGTADHTTISSGQQLIESGGLANYVQIDPNGEQIVLDGGNARNIFVGGIQSVYGTSDSTTVSFGGLQQVHRLTTNTTIRFNSHQNVYADGTAVGTTLYDGSVQIDWGIATNTIVGSNSAQYVWGVAVNTTLTRDFIGAGEQYVETGGSAHGTQVGAYSTQYVHGGGTSSGTVVGFLGNQVVYGTDADATIFGGTQDVWGVAIDATVDSGVQNVRAGGYARNTTIDGLASAHVFAGGAIENVTFGGGFAGLILDEGSSITGSIAGWQPFAAIDLGAIQFAEGTTTLAYAANSRRGGGTLTVSDGTHVIALSMLGQYTAADFAITSDGHGGTSVYDPVFLPATTLTPPAA